MPLLSPVSRRDLVARLRRLGFSGPFAGGKHEFMERRNVRVRVPNPHPGDVSIGLLKEVLRVGGVSEEEWEGAAVITRGLRYADLLRQAVDARLYYSMRVKVK